MLNLIDAPDRMPAIRCGPQVEAFQIREGNKLLGAGMCLFDWRQDDGLRI